jgi:hypothetical protein
VITVNRLEHIGSSRRLAAGLLLALGALTLGGCFDAPRLEDRWTRVDIANSNVTAFQSMTLGAPESIHVAADVTFRSILTGYAVAELRVSPTLTPTSLHVTPDATRLTMAQDIDSLLQHSYSVGRATRAVTGWDHLIQRIDFAFNATVPSVLDSTGATSGGLFLVCYLGAGDRVERFAMPETLIVTPFRSADYKILPVGMTFQPTAAGTP